MSDLQIKVDSFRWYHEIDLGDGVITKPDSRFTAIWDLIEDNIANVDFKGCRVLDVGARDGRWSFTAERMGASSVVAIDNDESSGALFLKDHLKSSVVFKHINFYDVDDGPYDIILFLGVLYHLRYPFTAMRKLAALTKPGSRVYIESGMLDAHHGQPMMYCPVRSSPYEVTSCSFFNMDGLVETMWSFGFTKRGTPCTIPSEQGQMVRRCWCEFEKTHDTPHDLEMYWESTHRSNP